MHDHCSSMIAVTRFLASETAGNANYTLTANSHYLESSVKEKYVSKMCSAQLLHFFCKNMKTYADDCRSLAEC